MEISFNQKHFLITKMTQLNQVLGLKTIDWYMVAEYCTIGQYKKFLALYYEAKNKETPSEIKRKKLLTIDDIASQIIAKAIQKVK